MSDHIRPMSHPPSPEERILNDVAAIDRRAVDHADASEAILDLEAWACEFGKLRHYEIERDERGYICVALHDATDDVDDTGHGGTVGIAARRALRSFESGPRPGSMSLVTDDEWEAMAADVALALMQRFGVVTTREELQNATELALTTLQEGNEDFEFFMRREGGR